MKKIVFSILLSLFTLASYAQNEGLYVDGTTWVCGRFLFHKKDSAEVSAFAYYIFIIDGDTVIGGNNYKKMEHYNRIRNWEHDYHYDTYFVRYENGKHLFYLPKFKKYYEEHYIDDDYLFFDENLKAGDRLCGSKYEEIAYIADTVFDDSKDEVRKYWKMKHENGMSSRYSEALNYVAWVEGIGSLSQPMPYVISAVDCACYNMLLYYINPAGNTIYRNQKYIDLLEPYFKTNVPALKSDNVSFTQRDGECVVTLPCSDAWSATLYNSVGMVVARRSGEGSEIVLPATSKGTHIFVLNVGGRVVKKKVFVR